MPDRREREQRCRVGSGRKVRAHQTVRHRSSTAHTTSAGSARSRWECATMASPTAGPSSGRTRRRRSALFASWRSSATPARCASLDRPGPSKMAHALARQHRGSSTAPEDGCPVPHGRRRVPHSRARRASPRQAPARAHREAVRETPRAATRAGVIVDLPRARHAADVAQRGIATPSYRREPGSRRAGTTARGARNRTADIGGSAAHPGHRQRTPKRRPLRSRAGDGLPSRRGNRAEVVRP